MPHLRLISRCDPVEEGKRVIQRGYIEVQLLGKLTSMLTLREIQCSRDRDTFLVRLASRAEGRKHDEFACPARIP